MAAFTALASWPGAAPLLAATSGSRRCGAWPAWEGFRDKFIQTDGRVIDFSADSHSTSEGQAYSLFFALVANDRASFDRILAWTRANLAGGDFSARLMTWKWGRRGDGSWGVLDENAASDADVWLAYTLFQAGRLWKDAQLTGTARLVEARLEQDVIRHVPGAGYVLLPGPKGFALASGGYKLNPSYLPLPVLRGLAREVPKGPWQELAKSTLAMYDAVTPQRYAPDWIAARPGKGFALEAETGLVGSYDAIRAYLWAGMMPAADPDRARLLARLAGMQEWLRTNGAPPERVDAASGQGEGSGPTGFSAALLPYLEALKDTEAARRQRERIAQGGGVTQVYYEQALALFAFGWLDRRYRFERDGRLAICTP